MTEHRKALRVHIGPVQGFIAAGRRARDFWAGSFLLSRLAGQAMHAVASKGGVITIPVLVSEDGKTEQTFQKIKTAEETKYAFDDRLPAGPLVGTLVNHFRAEVPDEFNARAIRLAVEESFQKLRDRVFKVFIEPALDKAFTKSGAKRLEVEERWKFQTSGSFFEVLWVEGPSNESDKGWQAECRWLDRRKMWRDHAPQLETAHKYSHNGQTVCLPGTGDRCPVHPEFCELGGFFRRHDRAKQEDFWAVLREVVGEKTYYQDGPPPRLRQFLDTLDLREGERLSGFALVKRLFPLLGPRHLAETIGWVPYHLFDPENDKPLTGQQAREAQFTLRNWPSTAFVAAIPWIVKVGQTDLSEAEAYAERQYQRLGADPILKAERPQRHRIYGIDRLAIGHKKVPTFAILDGTLHFKRGLEKRRVARGDGESLVRQLEQEFNAFLELLREQHQFKDGPASPFYAMLEMDGDGMGKVFSVNRPRAERGSRALLQFADGVPAIVRDHDGVLIYAGADDVKALLPIETAIPCALKLNEHWRETMRTKFQDKNDPIDPGNPGKVPTLSGSIVFADYQAALGDVYKLTHERLDKVAKDQAGRNALALAVLKSGGIVAEWASCWQRNDKEEPTAGPFADLQAYALSARPPKSRNAKAAGEPGQGDKEPALHGLASRLPYLIRDRFSELLKLKDGKAERFNDADVIKVLAQEIGERPQPGGEKFPRAKRVMGILRSYRRDAGESIVEGDRDIDGLLIARFLASQGLWSYYDDWILRASDNYDAWKKRQEGEK